MSFGKWLKGATRIRFDDRTLGNLTKNAAVAGGTALGGVGGLALAGLGSGAGQKMLGGSWGDAAGAGLKGASAAGGINAARGLLSSIGAGAGSASSALPSAGVTPAGAPVPLGSTDLTGSAFGYNTANAPTNLLDKAQGVGGRVLSFAEKHPNATSGALSAIGNLSTSGAQNRTANAQADLLEQQAGETAYDFQKRKMRDEQLAPLWGSLGSSIGSSYNGVAANPYLPKAG